MRVIKLFRLAKGFFVLFLIGALLTAIHQWTYSNVPLFTQFLIKTLMAQPGIAVGNVSVGEVHLPAFLLSANFFLFIAIFSLIFWRSCFIRSLSLSLLSSVMDSIGLVSCFWRASFTL